MEKFVTDKNVNMCSIFLNYVNENKEYFLNNDMKCKGSGSEHIPCEINDKFSMNKIGETFPTINCDMYIKPLYM